MRRIVPIIVASFMLAGCPDKPPETKVFKPLVETVDKARAVEGQVQEGAERRAADVEAETAAE
jgi:hypothetical protein